MSMDELAVMDGGKCLLQVRGVRPFLSKKYDITKHPNYKYLSDFNPKNTFDIPTAFRSANCWRKSAHTKNLTGFLRPRQIQEQN